MWTLSGECVKEYFGHNAFIFSITQVPGNHLVASASDDHTVKLWRGIRIYCDPSSLSSFILMKSASHVNRGQVRADVATSYDGVVSGSSG